MGSCVVGRITARQQSWVFEALATRNRSQAPQRDTASSRNYQWNYQWHVLLPLTHSYYTLFHSFILNNLLILYSFLYSIWPKDSTKLTLMGSPGLKPGEEAPVHYSPPRSTLYSPNTLLGKTSSLPPKDMMWTSPQESWVEIVWKGSRKLKKKL